MVFKSLYHTYVCNPLGSASAQDETHRLTRRKRTRRTNRIGTHLLRVRSR